MEERDLHLVLVGVGEGVHPIVRPDGGFIHSRNHELYKFRSTTAAESNCPLLHGPRPLMPARSNGFPFSWRSFRVCTEVS